MNVFSYTGIVMMVAGGGCGIAGFFTGFVGKVTLWSIAFTLLLMGVIFFFSGKRVGSFSLGRPSFVKQGTGLPGQATVMSMQETGITITSGSTGPEAATIRFGLQVQLPGRDPYMAEVTQSVPRMLLGAVLPGSVVAVTADPSDPNNVYIDWSVAPRPAGMSAPGMPANVPGVAGAPMGVPGGVAAGAPMPTITGQSSAAELLASGTPGWATVTMFQPLGTPRTLGVTPSNPAYIDDPVYMFVLQVTLDGQQPFQAQVGHRVPKHIEPTLQQGMTLKVAVDTSNPTQEVAIDWGEA
jgi:hypothetical protein